MKQVIEPKSGLGEFEPGIGQPLGEAGKREAKMAKEAYEKAIQGAKELRKKLETCPYCKRPL